MKILWLLLILTGDLFAMPVQVLGVKNPRLRSDTRFVLQDTVDTFNGKSGGPRLGNKPLTVGPGKVPRCVTNYLPKKYHITLTVMNTRYHDQMVYQLGHELGHVWIGPKTGGWFIEAVCHALSLNTLEQMKVHWHARGGICRRYASRFASYAERDTKQVIAGAKLKDKKALYAWVKREGKKAQVRRSAQRAHQQLFGIVVADWLKKYPVMLRGLDELGEATSGNKTDFRKWASLYPKGGKAIIELKNLLGIR